MSKSPTLALMMAAVAFVPTQSTASSLNDSVSPESLAAYCSQAGLGESAATLTLPDGSTVTGTVECEQEDLLVAEAEADDEDDDEDDEDEDDEDEDEDDDDDEDEDEDEDDDDDDDDDDGDSGEGGEDD